MRGPLVITDDEVAVGDVRFGYGPLAGTSHAGRLFVAKQEDLLRQYLAFIEGARGGNVLELGTFGGGSAALAALVAEPRLLVTIDIGGPPPHFLEFIRDHGLAGMLHPFFGIDQADADALGATLDDEFGDQALDLVIDDASHELVPTLVSFDLIFPRLRPGGVFVIEDWAWQEVAGAKLERALVTRSDLVATIGRALSNPRHGWHELAMAAVATLASRRQRPVGLDELLESAGVDTPAPVEDPLSDIAIPLARAVAAQPEIVASLSFKSEAMAVVRGPGGAPAGWSLEI